MYKIYQFGPKSTPEEGDRKYGSMYKLVYVPADFHQSNKDERLLQKLEHAFGSLKKYLKHSNDNHDYDDNQNHDQAEDKEIINSKTPVQRACFAVKGGIGSTIEPQTVLPNLVDFTFDSVGYCPHVNVEHRHKKCELWKLVNHVGDKKNTYKMWIIRDETTGLSTPVLYYMLGYDSLLGSHYDRYDITYHNFIPNSANDNDFLFDAQNLKCGSMPGPGDNSSSGEIRSHLVVQNPIYEYVNEPHRYDHIDHEFNKFSKDHEKDYNNEKHERKSWFNFLHNFRFIHSKNRELKEYKLSVNRYADSDINELRYLRGRLRSTGFNGGLDYEKHHNLRGSNGRALSGVPDSWDWNLLGAVTPVKDQAVCGSCWSFGTSGTIEGAYFVKTGKLPRLSQQQMVDCSWKYGNNGCDGGEDFRAYNYIMEAGGLAIEEDYGNYIGVDGKCHDKDVKKAVQISGFYNVTPHDSEALKHAVYNYGPVTVAIDASRPTFTFYSHGVYYDESCNNKPDGLDHQVLVVGYTKIGGKFVWLVKNSWSTNWGNNGYILMSAENNNCGLMDAPTVPIIKL